MLPDVGDPGLSAVVPAGKSKYPVDELVWSDTAVGVTDTVVHALSPRRNVDDDAVPVGLMTASVPKPKVVLCAAASASSNNALPVKHIWLTKTTYALGYS